MDLAASLRTFTDDELISLLSTRPDLAERGQSTFVDLANRALQMFSMQNAFGALSCFEREVLDAMVHLGEPATAIDIAVVPATPSDPLLIEPVLKRLRVLGLIVRSDTLRPEPISRRSVETDYYEVLREVKRVIPAPFVLHHSLEKLLDRYAMPDLRTISFNVGLPERTAGKVGLIADLVAKLGTPHGLASVFERGPHEAESLLRSIHDDLYGMISLDTRPWARSQIPEGISWLLGHGLLLPVSSDAVAIPREVALMLRGGAATPSFTPYPPSVEFRRERTGHEQPSKISFVELTPAALVEAIATIGASWARNPPIPLRTEGVAVKDIRALAKSLGVDENSVARLIELGGLAGLLSIDPFRDQVGPTPAFEEWLLDEPLSRWLVLAHAWAKATTTLSRVVRRDDGERSEAPLSPIWEGDLNEVWRRARTIEALGSAEPDKPVDLLSVAQRARWFSPSRWGGPLAYFDLVVEIMEEAALIGVVSQTSLTVLGRAVWLDGSSEEIEAAAEKVFPPATQFFTVSGDLSAIAPSELATPVALELSLIAELASSGGASVYRFTESSLRHAFDNGRSVQDVHDFLSAHAKPGVPQPLKYLIDDVGRRYGSVKIGSAVSYVRVEDPVVLAEMLRSKKTQKLKFHQLAPTVAISSLVPAKILKGLRDAGFFPVAEGENGMAIPAPSSTVSNAHRHQGRTKENSHAVAIWDGLRRASATQPRRGEASTPEVPMAIRAMVHTLRAKR
jgi:hypothetical protein